MEHQRVRVKDELKGVEELRLCTIIGSLQLEERIIF